jgi:hypothetical protein
MNKLRSLIKSYQFLLNCLALLSFFITHGCVQKGIKEESPSEEDKNQKVVEATSSEINSGWEVEFSEDFSKIKTGSEPESLFILDGAYTVQEGQNDEKSLTLPGSPMGDFGLLFGPRIREKGLELRFSFFSRKKGRRMPSIAAGIGGVRGLRLRLNPAARNLALSFDEQTLKEIPFSWIGDQWWSVRFQMTPEDSNQSTFVQYKLWPKQEAEPNTWLVSEKFSIQYKGGKCALWGFPYASTPILFDDLTILSQ